MTATEWIESYAGVLEMEAPSEDEITAILELAAEAAHSSERIAAPVACWLAARGGVALGDALERARGMQAGGQGR